VVPAARSLFPEQFTMKKAFFRFSSVVLLLTLFIPGCAKKQEPLPLSSGSIMTPYQEFGKATLFFYEGKYKRWKLEADYMKKPLLDTGDMLVTPVKLTYYDSLGRTRTRVLADSGTTTPSLQSFTVWGNVFIRNQDSLIVRTQKLWWVKEKRKVESNTFVQIETVKGDILRGKGLDAVEDFSRFTFKSQVSGYFPDFKKRMETNDDKMY
jgi:LPS export ABC transporter protein LptC